MPWRCYSCLGGIPTPKATLRKFYEELMSSQRFFASKWGWKKVLNGHIGIDLDPWDAKLSYSSHRCMDQTHKQWLLGVSIIILPTYRFQLNWKWAKSTKRQQSKWYATLSALAKPSWLRKWWCFCPWLFPPLILDSKFVVLCCQGTPDLRWPIYEQSLKCPVPQQLCLALANSSL